MPNKDVGPDPIVVKDVEKQYGALRPLRVRDLRVPAGRVTVLIGFDRPAAEIFVNLITGSTLPDKGEVISLTRPTQDIVNSDEWLSFVEHFGIVSDRIVLLEAMTVAQNLAISFDLELDPIPADVAVRVSMLAAEAGIDAASLTARVGEATPLLRSRIYLARALAVDPAVLVLEHPTAQLAQQEATEYAALVRRIAETRHLTTLALVMDEKFATATGGRLLVWQPATGEMHPPSRLVRWWRAVTSER
jgi:ABC-type transporter Mla maintaining outer membrane lipid asymmetry ATPase subunit MlaF